MASIDTNDLLICVACGTQFDQAASEPLENCRICDDPRQYLPPSGQSWTCLRKVHEEHVNQWLPIGDEQNIWSIRTEPKFAIGQRCILITTPHGNVLWDCITKLDETTKSFINNKGGLKAIVISHPHFYSTHLMWAEAFDCPVYISSEDEVWCSRSDTAGRRKLISAETQQILAGIDAIKVGGHFAGSMVLRFQPDESTSGRKDASLFIADSLFTVPSALYHIDRLQGTTSYSFMWSIPNMVPLPPKAIMGIWKALKPWSFGSTHGLMIGMDVWDENVKSRVLESMKIQCRAMGWDEEEAEVLRESWP